MHKIKNAQPPQIYILKKYHIVPFKRKLTQYILMKNTGYGERGQICLQH